jgi:hypothetical protein
MAGEDPAQYQNLVELVHGDLQPQDLQEWLLVRDIVNAEWELLRLRGMKVGMLHAMLPRAVSSLICDAQGFVKLEAEWVVPLRKLLIGKVAGDEKAKQKLERLLGRLGLSLDVVTAATFEETIHSQVHTDRMVAAAYERRNMAYAELERRRAKQTKTAGRPSDDEEIVQEVGAPRLGDDGNPVNRADHSVSGKAT